MDETISKEEVSAFRQLAQAQGNYAKVTGKETPREKPSFMKETQIKDKKSGIKESKKGISFKKIIKALQSKAVNKQVIKPDERIKIRVTESPGRSVFFRSEFEKAKHEARTVNWW